MLTKPQRPLPYAMGRRTLLPKFRSVSSAALPSLSIIPVKTGQTNQRAFQAGGDDWTPGFTPINTINRFTKATEAYGLIAATISTIRAHGGAGLRTKVNGYICGGGDSGPNPTSEIERFNLAAESNTLLANTLPAARECTNQCSISNVFSKGYISGGQVAGPVDTNTICSVTYASETAANISAVLSAIREHICSVTSYANGYLMGGSNAGALAIIQRLNLSTEVVTTLAATLDTARLSAPGINSISKGYVCGGVIASFSTATIEDMDFTVETSTTIAAVLDQQVQSAGGASFTDKGYKFGGYNALAGLGVATIDSLTWSFETVALLATSMSVGRADPCSLHTPGMP